MGWNPFKKTVTYQYWNVATTGLVDDNTPDGFHQFAVINDAVNGIDYFKSLEYLNYNAGSKVRLHRLTNKFESQAYFGGFAEVNIGNNYVPASLVKARINPSDPSAVTITNSNVAALDYAAWAELHLVDLFGLNATTNTFVSEGVTFSVDFSTADSINNTVEVTNTTSNEVTTLNLPPEPAGSSYNVTYTISTTETDFEGNTTVTQSDPKTWTYEIGSGVYPELDVYTTLPENDPTVFQIMPPLEIRKNNSYSYNSTSRHADYDDYADKLGISPKDISDAFAGQSDMDKLDHITVSQGVDLKAEDKHSLRYCIDFLVKLKALAKTHTFDYEVNGTADNVQKGFNTQNTKGYTDSANTSYNTSHRYVAKELVDIPGVDLIVSYDDFAYGLKYSHIDIQHHTKTEVDANTTLRGVRDDPIDVSKHGRVTGGTKYKSTITTNFGVNQVINGVTLDGGIWGYLSSIMTNLSNINVAAITYYKINNDGSVDSYMIVNPVIAHYVRDAGSGQHKLVYIDLNTADSEVRIPLDWRILKKYDNQTMTALHTGSLHLVMYYAYWEQKREWNWGLILIVVVIVVYVYTGYNVSSALAETATSLSVALGVTMSTAYIIMAVSYLAAMGVFGEDYILLGQIMSLGISMATSAYSLGANMYTANTALQVVNMMNSYKMRHLIDEMEQIASLGASQALLQQEIQDDLDDAYEEMGYYYHLRKQKYVQQGLININKVDHFDPMPSAVYFQKVKKTISPRHTFRLQYKYT